jgi:type IV secretion system protein TrbG
MNFSYTFKGGDDSIRPLQVFDDGKKAFIKMNPKMNFREAPALVVIGPDERPEMLNYRVKDDMYVVDRIFDRAELVLGAGKKAKKWRLSVKAQEKGSQAGPSPVRDMKARVTRVTNRCGIMCGARSLSEPVPSAM